MRRQPIDDFNADTESAVQASLIKALAHFNLPHDGRTLQRLLHYFHLLFRWRQVYNLFSTQKPWGWWLHAVDGLAVAQQTGMLHVKHCLDLGSGAGFPAMINALLHPHRHFVLSEIDRNKAAFLHQVKIELALHHVAVEGDWGIIAQNINLKKRRAFDLITAKAFVSPQHFALLLPQIVGVGGYGLLCYRKNETQSWPPNLLKSTLSYIPPPCVNPQGVVLYQSTEPRHLGFFRC